MAYFAPYIDATGFHRPLYSDILEYLLNSFKSIYGQDVYLGNDSWDYQWISVVAYRLNDTMLVLQQNYENRGPQSAIGAALDGVVKINGLTRKVASYSTCTVELTGTPLTVIVNGVVQDSSGYYWSLPQVTMIGEGGTVSATATCQTIGDIAALSGAITTIATPQFGWNTVSNSLAASLGQPVETDEQLRARQALSTRTASHTMLSGTTAGVAAVEGVTRYNIHENTAAEPDEHSCPGHSITCVVEGGADEDVAMAIFFNRGIGCHTNGFENDSPVSEYSVSIAVTDPDTGEIMTINFLRPEYKDIYVSLDVKALTGYTDSVTEDIRTAIYDYLNDLQIGQGLTISGLYAAAMAVMTDIRNPLFSITELKAGLDPGSMVADDIEISFKEVTKGNLGSPEYIEINVTT